MKIYASGNSQYLILPKKTREKYNLHPDTEYLCFVDKDGNIIYKPVSSPTIDTALFDEPILSKRAEEILALLQETPRIYIPSLKNRLGLTYSKRKCEQFLRQAMGELHRLGHTTLDGTHLVLVEAVDV